MAEIEMNSKPATEEGIELIAKLAKELLAKEKEKKSAPKSDSEKLDTIITLLTEIRDRSYPVVNIPSIWPTYPYEEPKYPSVTWIKYGNTGGICG